MSEAFSHRTASVVLAGEKHPFLPRYLEAQREDEMEEFISEPISVDYDDERMQPSALRWRGESYVVVEVISAWQDWHTPSYADHARSWIHRRHRNYYVVRTAQGPVFEIYLDRGSGKRDWVLLKRKG